MQLTQIITLASRPVEPLFRIMERSLRAVGCDLPLKVIPFSEDRFPLPPNAEWWENKEFLSWIDVHGAKPVMRKYQVLLTESFQFVDTDVVFLRNPQGVLDGFIGWVNSCTHWHNPSHTLTPELEHLLRQKTTVWQWLVFNTGQFACDRALYDFKSLKQMAESERHRATVLNNRYHEQPGINLLVNQTDCPITNLTLPPYCMESTWAGDYTGTNYRATWTNLDRSPYLIHWAGRKIDGSAPIDNLALDILSQTERQEFIQRYRIVASTPLRVRLCRAIRGALAGFKEN